MLPRLSLKVLRKPEFTDVVIAAHALSLIHISELQTHYDNIKRMVKEKTGRAMQEKERERKGKNGKIIKVAGIKKGMEIIQKI